jgi:signal recognition particle subunit SRP54
VFESLSERLGGVFDKLRGRGSLNELDVRAAMREVRVALLEADVALPVAKKFIDEATTRAIGAEVIRSVTPGQQVVKIVHDCLIEMLGGEAEGLNVGVTPPAVIMLVGLQGSGKTTTTAKLAKRLTERERKKVLMASLDVNRPAAQQQLAVLGEQTGITTLPIIPGQLPVEIARRAKQAAKLQGFDVLMLDTAGRLHVDQALMAEMKAVAGESRPDEVLLVVDALTGQDAVNVASSFTAEVPLTGVILTRMDGDARGGAALSMRAVTGRPIKFVGTGEKLDGLDEFHPERVAGRILGMGDVVSLVERAAETIEAEEAEKLAAKMAKGQFDMNDLRQQFVQMKKMGGLSAMAGLMPGLAGAQKQMAAAGVNEKTLARMEALILSMTPKERLKPELLNAKRKIRVAKGAGQTVQEVNRLLKMHQEMAGIMKRIKKMGGLQKLGAMFGGGGAKGLQDALGGLGGAGGAAAGGMPGGAKLPGGLPPGMEKLLKR